MKHYKKLRWLGVLPLLLAALLLFAPWESWLEQKIIRTLRAQGLGPVTLTLDHVGLSGITLRDVTLGQPPLKLAQVTVGYHLGALLSGELNSVRLQGLAINLTHDALGWNIDGLPTPPRNGDAAKKTTLPVSAEALSALPFTQLSLIDSSIQLAAKNIQASLMLDATLQHGPTNSLRLDARDVRIALPMGMLNINGLRAQFTLDEAAQQWHGDWAFTAQIEASDTMTVPTLTASGTLTVFANAVQFTGSIASDDTSYEAQFSGEVSLVDASRSHLKVLQAHVPWSGGEIALNKAKIPLSGDAPIALSLEVKKVEIDSLMQALTGNKATASGVVSGIIPLRISKTGQVMVGKTSLKAQGPGIISLSPEVIPGDNAQVATVRELLKNLHYTVLTLDLAMAPDNTLSATLAVEGKNPDAEQSRPVKLNVHLSGDLLNFIVQNNQLLSDPKSFIEKNHHD